MNRRMLMAFLAVLLMVLVDGPVLAMTGDRLEQWQPKELSELPGMSPAGVKFMLGSSDADGIRSVAYLNDVRQQMAKYGLKQTHHIMVFFKEMKNGKPLAAGTAKVAVVGPDGRAMNNVALFAMDGGFGADVALTQKGRYRFKIRALLSDRKERFFEHFFIN